MAGRRATPLREVPDQLLTCEQLLLTSANRNLEGGGFGVLAHSEGWPLGRTAGGLGGLARFLPQGSEARIRAGAVPPTCILRALTDDGGVLVARKVRTVSDAQARGGNHLNQLLWTGRRDLDALTVLQLLRYATWVEQDTLPPPTRSLPPVTIPAVPAPRRERPAEAPAPYLELLAAVHTWWRDGGPPVCVVSESGERIVDAIEWVLESLPTATGVDLTFSTFEVTARGDYAVTGLVPPFSTVEAAHGVVVQLDHPGLARAGDPVWGHLAPSPGQLVTAALPWSAPRDLAEVAGLPDVHALETWCSSRNASAMHPERMGPDDVAAVLASPHADRWLALPGSVDRVLAEVMQGRLLVAPDDVHADGGDAVRPAVLAVLRRQQIGASVRALAHGAASRRLDGLALATWVAAATELGDAGPDAQLECLHAVLEVAPASTSGGLGLDDLHDVVLARCSELTTSERRLCLRDPSLVEAAELAWCALSETLLLQDVGRLDDPDAAASLARLMRRHPEHSRVALLTQRASMGSDPWCAQFAPVDRVEILDALLAVLGGGDLDPTSWARLLTDNEVPDAELAPWLATHLRVALTNIALPPRLVELIGLLQPPGAPNGTPELRSELEGDRRPAAARAAGDRSLWNLLRGKA